MNRVIPHFQIAWEGLIIIIGFGSIGRAVLPLIYRHLQGVKSQVTVIDPDDRNRHVADEYGAYFLHAPLTQENYRETLSKLIQRSSAQSLIINVSTNVSSKEIIAFAHSVCALYIDTSIDPWPGVYFNAEVALDEKSNYLLRESLLELKKSFIGGPTAISCCGANPGMVSWFVKQALLDIARETIGSIAVPAKREDWARLMMTLEIKGIHIAERDTQRTGIVRNQGCFLNTWSAEGFLAEALQPAELGWGTHEKSLPCGGRVHTFGCGSAIYLQHPGGTQKVRTWTPSHGQHFGFLISHNEAISISDYFTVRDGVDLIYRPTCLYAYRPTDVAVESLAEVFEHKSWRQNDMRVLREDEIIDGYNELGVLVYGHKKNAYWFGSKLSIDEARTLAPYQNATSLQVSSALLSGIIWAINHPHEGLVEAEELNFEQCLNIQRPYLGILEGCFTEWNPQKTVSVNNAADADPWQFSNMRI